MRFCKSYFCPVWHLDFLGRRTKKTYRTLNFSRVWNRPCFSEIRVQIKSPIANSDLYQIWYQHFSFNMDQALLLVTFVYILDNVKPTPKNSLIFYSSAQVGLSALWPNLFDVLSKYLNVMWRESFSLWNNFDMSHVYKMINVKISKVIVRKLYDTRN